MHALLAVEDQVHPIWRLFFETGARRGEIVGLTDDDVDGARVAIRRQVLVHPSRTWDQDRIYVRETTRSRRDRVVVVSDGMAAELRAWKALATGVVGWLLQAQPARERLAFGPAYHDDGWICAEADGSRIAPDTLSARFAALERRAAFRTAGCTRAATLTGRSPSLPVRGSTSSRANSVTRRSRSRRTCTDIRTTTR